MKTSIIDITGKKQGTIELPDEIFAAKIAPEIIPQYLRIYQSHSRQNGATTKHRGDVTGTTAKVWRQKGTGRARHGSRKAPIFVGGGKAHGPINPNHHLNFSKRLKRMALFGAFTAKTDSLLVLENLNKELTKTQEIQQILTQALGWDGKQKITIVLAQPQLGLIRTAKNLTKVNLTQAKRINAFEILNSDKLVLMQDSVDVLKQVFLATQNETKEPTAPTTTKSPTKKAK